MKKILISLFLFLVTCISAIALTTDTLTLTSSIDAAKAAPLASASTVEIGYATGNLVHITGTTTITSFGAARQAGVERTIVFDGALTLTHSASLVLPGGSNITTAAGDTATFVADTPTTWRCTGYTYAGASTISGGTTISGNVTVSSNSAVLGNSSVTGTMDITGNTSISGATDIDSLLTANGVTFDVTTLTYNSAIPAGVSHVALYNSTNGIAATIAAPETGHWLVITQTDTGTQGHVVTLQSGYINGVYNTATFNAARESLVLYGIASDYYLTVLNYNSVSLGP